MISPEGIRKQAGRWWADVLRSGLTNTAFFPAELLRIGKVKTSDRLRDFDRIRNAQNALIAQSKSRIGKGYTLYWIERDFRNIGRNRFISRITFDTLEDYLFFMKRGATYQRTLSDAQLIYAQVPELRQWCFDNILLIEKHHAIWPNLLRVIRYFVDHHQMDQHYIRELPIAVPTKFIESNKAVITSILDAVLPPECIRADFTGTRYFEQRYGLKFRQPLIRLRLLDNTIATEHFNGLTDMSIPVSDFNTLQLPLQRVFILENKTNFSNLMNFLTLPQMAASAGIFGSGFRIGLLQQAQWLHKVDIFYWGDLDAHGLQIVSQLRGYFPHVQPFLMDRATFDALSEYHVMAPPCTAEVLPHLTEKEQALFTYLNNNRLRVEQERISVDMVRKFLNVLMC